MTSAFYRTMYDISDVKDMNDLMKNNMCDMFDNDNNVNNNNVNNNVMYNVICIMLDVTLKCVITLLLGYVGYNIGYQYYRRIRYNMMIPPEAVPIPFASGALPLVGHGLSFSKDIIGFIKEQYTKYGPIFRIQVFRSEFVVICDHSLKDEYFKKSENDFSLYDALRRIYFGEAFSDRVESLETIIKIVKSTVKVDYDIFSKKIIEEAHVMIARLRENVQNDPDRVFHLKDEMIRFVARTSARCFISVDISDDFFDTLMEFTDLLNQLVIMTYFLPRKVIKWTMGRKLDKLRHQLTNQLVNTIEEYRADPDKKDSLVFRKAVDWEDNQGCKLTNLDIGDIVVCLLYVSSENTALGLTNSIIDMIQNPDCISTMLDEIKGHLKNNDFRSVFSNKYLDACVMESARMNTHIFPLNRRSKHSSAMLGQYYIGDTECVAICEPIMMKDADGAAAKFASPATFNPQRFLTGLIDGQGPESKDAKSVMTWGAGTHLCPGKHFAVLEIKTALALLFNTFEFVPNKVGTLEYFSPSAYAERSIDARLKIREINEVAMSQNKYVTINGHKVQMEEMSSNDEKFWILREAIPIQGQKNLYQMTLYRANGTIPYQVLSGNGNGNRNGNDNGNRNDNGVKKDVAIPLAYDNLIYTNSSTCSLDFWMTWADEMYSQFNGRSGVGLEPKKFDSVYVQLYNQKSSMKSHKDQYVNWGISVSIGASCTFKMGEHVVNLHSGDVMIADFSKIEHSVVDILDTNIPGWFNPETKEEGSYLETFGNVRCSIQIRDISKCPRPDSIMSNDEFLAMLMN